LGFHAVALARLGRLPAAEAAATQVIDLAEADPTVGLDDLPARLALGITALAAGRFDDAAVHLRLVDQAKRDAGIREPRFCAHASDLIEALIGTGNGDEATEVLRRLEADAATSAGQWSLAAAARCRALVLAASGELGPALAAADESVSLLDGLPMPVERARSVFVLGQIRRRRKEKRLAREALTDALHTFEAANASTWADRARAELARIPQRQPAPGPGAVAGPAAAAGLTSTEETIARLAVEGLTNREIADRVFVSSKTVEVNLTRIYRKLGVRSRAGLANRLAGGLASQSAGERRPET
jgi:DNA-binding CsgD family transcriptional regulator